LAWYDAQGRTLPWRIRPEERAAGQVADPYAVWLSEVMLQQTTVPHATPYWRKFLAEFPTVIDLANADRDRVLTMWAGLGYYARARNLHKCAGVVRDEHDGEFPRTEAQLLKLPGIGPYTAATIAAICFDEATNIVDGNVCPWQDECDAFKDNTQIDYPKKVKKAKLSLRYGAVFVLMSEGKVLLRRRPDKGLLGGMMGFPGTEWGRS